VPVRVVIAEDEWLIAAALRQELEDRGYEVLAVAGTGEAAVEAVASIRPDVVVMDIGMPGMDGLEATRLVMDRCPACVIVVTGRWGQADAAVQAGAMDCVGKPLTGAAIDRVVERARGRFRRYGFVQAEAGGHGQAMATWLAVRCAMAVLAARGARSEEAAFEGMRRLAAEGGMSLREAAERVLSESAAEPA